MLFLFLLGQGVWIYHVRELKVKELKGIRFFCLLWLPRNHPVNTGNPYLPLIRLFITAHYYFH